MYINLGPVGWYMTPSRAARAIFENFKIYSIFDTAPVASMGASQLWLKTQLAPSSVHAVWKF